jgi:hypothetical protein
MSIHDGDPAFPIFPETETGHAAAFRGMTLRDYFAAKAMQADLEYQGLEGREDLLHVAAMSYQMADAMLKAREATI